MSISSTTEDYLASTYPEVEAMAFYRDLFPRGELDTAGSYTKGKYTGIAIQLKDNKQPRVRLSITDNLTEIESLIVHNYFTVISPLSYAGKSQESRYQRKCYAIAVDLDNLLVEDNQPIGIMSLLSQIELADKGVSRLIPRPTYIAVSSPNNIHLYYLLDKPINLWKRNKEALAKHKEALTKVLWNQYVTADYKNPQYEALGQGMRAVGSIRKDKSGIVRAFKVGERVSTDYLNSFSYAKDAQLLIWDKQEHETGNKITYRATKGNTKPWVYEWYKEQVRDKAVEGKRYFQLLVLAVFGLKCGIPYEKVKQDALELVPYLDSLTKRPNNRFTRREALTACKAYEKPHFVLLKRETLVRLSGIPMRGNKRNGLPQNLHLELARARKAALNKAGYGHAKNAGRPAKRPYVKAYLADNPFVKPKDAAEYLGVSRSTVYNALKELREG